jgi:transposase
MPEVGWNRAVLYRKLQAMGFTGGRLQVQRFARPVASSASGRNCRQCVSRPDRTSSRRSITGRFGFGSARSLEKVHLFVFTLGYSRWLYSRGDQNERLATLPEGHQRAFGWFGGVTLTCLRACHRLSDK